MFVINFKKLKNPKISYIFKKTLGVSIVCSKCGHDYKRYFLKKESIKIFKKS